MNDPVEELIANTGQDLATTKQVSKMNEEACIIQKQTESRINATTKREVIAITGQQAGHVDVATAKESPSEPPPQEVLKTNEVKSSHSELASTVNTSTNTLIQKSHSVIPVLTRLVQKYSPLITGE